MEQETLGFCAVVKAHKLDGVKVGPITLNPDERLAMEVYNYAVSLSGFDMNGLPQITNLELALQLCVKESFTEQRFEELVERIMFIHQTIYKNEADKIPKK